MADSKLQRISLTSTSRTEGIVSRRTITQETLRLHYAGGTVHLRQSAVEGTGESWKLLKKRLYTSAKQRDIPFDDLREH